MKDFAEALVSAVLIAGIVVWTAKILFEVMK